MAAPGWNRFRTLTRQMGAWVAPAKGEPGAVGTPHRRPSGTRSLLERLPAPRGHDALHDRGPTSHLLQWFADDDEAVVRKSLAQRASEVLAGLGPLQLPARQVDDGLPGGMHRSLRRGGGVEFSEHKDYAPGDDLRMLDWKAYGRTDRYVIKRYEQEVHATLTLILDASGSMQLSDFASDKFDAVRLLLACIALVLIRQGDSVGLAVLGRPQCTIAPGVGLRHFAHIAETLAAVQPDGDYGLDRFEPVPWRGHERRGLAMVASDVLVAPDKAMVPLTALQRSGLGVLLLHTLHPRELDLGFTTPAQFTCRESARQRTVDPRVMRDAYTTLMRQHCEAVAAAAAHGGVGHVLVDTSFDPRGLIRQVLRATTHLRVRGGTGAQGGGDGEKTFDSQSVLVGDTGEWKKPAGSRS